MPQTVADLLKTINLDHKLQNAHPILNTHNVLDLPLILFRDEEHFDLITILWLLGEELALPKQASTRGKKLAELSEIHVNTFYDHVKNELLQARSNNDNTGLVQIKSKPNPWMSTQQVTLWLSQFDTYQKLLYPTLGIFYKQLGVVIDEEQLPKDIRYILNQNLHQMNLSYKQIIDLSFYFFLFLYEYADIEFELCNYTYADPQMSADLHDLAETQQLLLEIALEKQIRPFTDQLASNLGKELCFKNINPPPYLLGLICFENCPILKSLFLDSWKTYRINHQEVVNLSSFALSATQNSFFFGEIIFSKKTKQALPCSNNDAQKLVQMIKMNQGIHSNTPTFFSLPTNLNQKQFNRLKSEIQNQDLRDAITERTINDYELKPVINYGLACSFLLEYGIDSPSQLMPPAQKLQDFLILFNPEYLETTCDSLLSNPTFINLKNSAHLEEHLRKVTQNLEQLDQKLNQNIDPEAFLEHAWFNAQKMLWSRCNAVLAEKIALLEAQQADVQTIKIHGNLIKNVTPSTTRDFHDGAHRHTKEHDHCVKYDVVWNSF